MTAQAKGVKRRVVITRKNTTAQYSPPELPEKPSVKIGPRCYGRSKRGRYIVVRFFVSQLKRPGVIYSSKRHWWVVDFQEGKIAEGTSKTGYADKEEAVSVARRCRDKYGAWARSEF